MPHAQPVPRSRMAQRFRSEEHTSELQSRSDLVCRLLLEKKKCCIINDKAKVLNDIMFSSFDVSPHPVIINHILDILTNSLTISICLIWLLDHTNYID